MNELTLLHSQIDRAFNDLIDLDIRISKLTNRSIGFQTLKDLKQELANNARKAVYAPRHMKVANEVLNKNRKIKDVAKEFGISPSTVRADLDKAGEQS